MRSRLLESGFDSQLSVSSRVSSLLSLLFFSLSVLFPLCLLALLPGCLAACCLPPPLHLKAGTHDQARTCGGVGGGGGGGGRGAGEVQ